MIIQDRIFKRNSIREKILVELIQSETLQRLKRIQQQGVPQSMLLPSMPRYTRYEHSIGVMLLLRKLGASVEEQAAGLLHDASHTAFSHIIDEVLGNIQSQKYQDDRHRNYLLASDAAQILRKHGFNPSRISNLEAYPLLERESPDLCADRIENILRYWYYMGRKQFISDTLASLTVFNNELVFKSKAAARKCATFYIEMFWEGRGWGSQGVDFRIRLYLFAEVLKLALRNRIISKADLYVDDLHVLRKLSKGKDQEINRILSFLKSKKKIRAARNPQFYLKYKFRYVDPKYLHKGKPVRLSESDASFRELVRKSRAKSQIGVGYRNLFS